MCDTPRKWICLGKTSCLIDASGLTIAPGLIDTHIHFRDPGFTYKEDLHTGSLAAAKGGVTTVICMANTSPTVDSVPVLEDILTRAKGEGIRIFQASAISHSLNGETMTDMDAFGIYGSPSIAEESLVARDCMLALSSGADVVIFDPDACWTPTEYASKSCNTPFTGQELYGKVKYTVCRGCVVYQD